MTTESRVGSRRRRLPVLKFFRKLLVWPGGLSVSLVEYKGLEWGNPVWYTVAHREYIGASEMDQELKAFLEEQFARIIRENQTTVAGFQDDIQLLAEGVLGLSDRIERLRLKLELKLDLDLSAERSQIP